MPAAAMARGVASSGGGEGGAAATQERARTKNSDAETPRKKDKAAAARAAAPVAEDAKAAGSGKLASKKRVAAEDAEGAAETETPRPAKQRKLANGEASSTKFKPARAAEESNGKTVAVEAEAKAAASAAERDANGNLPVSAFDINPKVQAALSKRGITHLFPIQERSWRPVLAGKDMIGRARTGTGKTLAFALPVVELLLRRRGSAKPATGRAPSVLVLTPTRELALQVSRDFAEVGVGLETTCIYGGAAYGPQQAAMRRGVDVVVGTVGRVMDHLERGMLKLDKVQFVILDEADEMLDMGFEEQVEAIMKAIPRDPAAREHPLQTLLFSATVPPWVQKVAKSYLQTDYVTIDLVGDSKAQAATTVRHLLLACHWAERGNLLADLVKCYCGSKGSVIVFSETKQHANELLLSSSVKQDAQVLHGDISQAQRETTLKAFRNKAFRVLVATDVAARGLDISGIDLVIQCEPPQHHETYIHRAGRTGRAGKTGVCVTMYQPKQLFFVQNIERRAGVKFEKISPPSPVDLMRAAAAEAREAVNEVDAAVLPMFAATAREMLAERSPEDALAAALAALTGHTAPPKQRSLLSASTEHFTVMLTARVRIGAPGFVWNLVRTHLFTGGDADEKVRNMRFTLDRKSAVFDVPCADRPAVEALAARKLDWIEFSIPNALPPLEEPTNVARPPQRRFSRGRRVSGGGGGGGGRYGGRKSM